MHQLTYFIKLQEHNYFKKGMGKGKMKSRMKVVLRSTGETFKRVYKNGQGKKELCCYNNMNKQETLISLSVF